MAQSKLRQIGSERRSYLQIDDGNGETYNILRKFETRKIFDVFMFCIDDLRQVDAVNDFLVDVHRHTILVFVIVDDIVANNSSNHRTPKHHLKSYNYV